MKKLDIIYFGDIKAVNGVNLVTNLILNGKKIFNKHGIELLNIFSSTGNLNCIQEVNLPIGYRMNTPRANLIRGIRSIFRVFFDARIPFFAWFKFKINYLNPAQKVIYENKYKFKSDYILFQDIFTAYFYYKICGDTSKKTILVMHSEEDIYQQFRILFPGIFKSKYLDELNTIFSYSLKMVDMVVFVSEKSALKNQSISKRVDFVYNGMPDFPMIKITNDSAKHSIVKFVCVGSMGKRKGQELIIKAAASLPAEIRNKCRFYLVGDGPELDSFKKMVNEMNLNESVFFLGLRNDVENILREMDAMILMSKSEGLPLSIIEGLRQGLYIIATDVGGVSEMVGEEFGKLVERSEESLKEVIEEIIDRDIINEHSRIKSREHYLLNFTVENMITKYSLLFNSINRDED